MTYSKEDVDRWVKENESYDAYGLLDQEMPGMRVKLNRLDSRIREVLAEVHEHFPDATYYTASGGFNLMLGPAHEDTYGTPPQQQRLAWSGRACIDDGDF